ncbi:MAG: hypothetical protein JXX14_18280 [Deltaproteobacteria bacterium]|nr:hypothetical protein [Deltaproteobacteria bacterium]
MKVRQQIIGSLLFCALLCTSNAMATDYCNAWWRDADSENERVLVETALGRSLKTHYQLWCQSEQASSTPYARYWYRRANRQQRVGRVLSMVIAPISTGLGVLGFVGGIKLGAAAMNLTSIFVG